MYEEKKKNISRLIISDVHLGSRHSNAKELLETLEKYSFEELIIAGDLQEDNKPIEKEQFRLIEYLHKHRKKIVYLWGNHDRPGESSMGNILGIKSQEKYELELYGKKFCIFHGDQFDTMHNGVGQTRLAKIISNLFLGLKKIEFLGYNLGKKIINLYDTFVALKITNNVKLHAFERGYDVVICGHTHVPLHTVFYDKKKDKKIHYYNCGGWVDHLYTFLTINKKGNIILHRI